MATAVIMPKQGQSVESCILTELRKKKGDKVAPGDVLFAYETDKASFEEEAREAGEILEVFFDEGDEIPVLTNVLVIGNPGEPAEEFRPGGGEAPAEAAPAAPASEPTPAPAPAAAPAAAPAPAAAGPASGISPRAKGLAEKYAVDTSAVAGSGPGGRIIARDVIASIERTPKTTPLAKAHLQQGGVSAPAEGTGLAGAVCSRDLAAGSAPAATSTAAAPQGAATADGDGVIKPLTNMRKLIAKAMHASLQNSAQLTHHLSADARRIQEFRKTVKKAGGTNITLNDMVCFAVIKALKKFPQVNSHFLGDSMKYFNRVHLGLAVDTDRGLMVPALRDADMLSLEGLAIKLKEMAEACRAGSVNPDILSSEAASFTVSNLGNYGVEVFTPVINLPQSAILGVNTIIPRPKDIGGGIYAFVPHIGLSLTYDHRALDGGEATRFLAEIASQIENFEAAL